MMAVYILADQERVGICFVRVWLGKTQQGKASIINVSQAFKYGRSVTSAFSVK